MRTRSVLCLCLLLALSLFAAAPSDRGVSLKLAVFRPGVSDAADTPLAMPGAYFARETLIANGGAARVYFCFENRAVNVAADAFVEPGECLPPIYVRWRAMNLRAASGAVDMRVFAGY